MPKRKSAPKPRRRTRALVKLPGGGTCGRCKTIHNQEIGRDVWHPCPDHQAQALDQLFR